MPWPDLRTFLAALRSRGDLLRIPEMVDWEYEAVALTRRTSDMEGPALLFENVRVMASSTRLTVGVDRGVGRHEPLLLHFLTCRRRTRREQRSPP